MINKKTTPNQSPSKREGRSWEENTWRVTERLVAPALLLLLREQNSHGYELLQRIDTLGLSPDASVVYRNLRKLEEEGTIRSEWQTKGPGSAKRVYKLTADGQDLLEAWIITLTREKTVFENFLTIYAGKLKAQSGCNPCESGDPCCEVPDTVEPLTVAERNK
ncbi:helix-turn-helix transcriptional regulator [Caldithrix abyssi]|nr:helix-turn-helix transcriptional regulator [Caldithrix abyssi]